MPEFVGLPIVYAANREKEALARSHSRALEAAKQAAADERTAWRAAVTEKLKRQAAEREEKLRAELLKQRDEQLEVRMGILANIAAVLDVSPEARGVKVLRCFVHDSLSRVLASGPHVPESDDFTRQNLCLCGAVERCARCCTPGGLFA